MPSKGVAAGAPRLSIHDLKSPLAGPFTLDLTAGACVAVSGPSGAGKSLFLRMIADLDPNTGEVRLDGTPRARFSGPEWRRKVPYVAADSGWWADAVRDHFAPGTHESAKALAERFALDPELFGGPVLRLSTGERQRLAIIRALVLDPPVLLLDEPTAPLDPDSTARVETELKARLEAGLALVIVSHEAAQAKRLAAQRIRIRDRRMEPAA